jgi:hypothetical protein
MYVIARSAVPDSQNIFTIVGISLTFFFHFIYFLDFKFMSDLLHLVFVFASDNGSATIGVVVFVAEGLDFVIQL